MNLKQAQKTKSDLNKFIREHEKDAPADRVKFDRAVTSMAQQTKKPAQGTSREDSSES